MGYDIDENYYENDDDDLLELLEIADGGVALAAVAPAPADDDGDKRGFNLFGLLIIGFFWVRHTHGSNRATMSRPDTVGATRCTVLPP